MTITDALCPLPGCDDPLHIVWTASRPVYLEDTIEDLQNPSHAYTADWKVECEEGHVVLLPVTPVGACRDVEVFGDGYYVEDDDYTQPSDLERLHALLAIRQPTS